MTKKRVLITGHKGFIGQNLWIALQEDSSLELRGFGRDGTRKALREAILWCDVIVHLAGVNRADSPDEFLEVNADLTSSICKILEDNNHKPKIYFSSSRHVQQLEQPSDKVRHFDYCNSKKIAEQRLLSYSEQSGATVNIERFPGIFGKWSKSNYNSVVSTFCDCLANDQKISVDNPEQNLELLHIDHVVQHIREFIFTNEQHFPAIEKRHIHQIKLGELAVLLSSFKHLINSPQICDTGFGLTRELYSTYVSYLSPENFTYEMVTHSDHRGDFAEFVKNQRSGQVSIFTSHPGKTRGGHYHHTKTETFVVLVGSARFDFLHKITGETFSVTVSDEKLTAVRTVPGWTHSITNVGKDKLIAVLWANEVFDQSCPDTFASEI